MGGVSIICKKATARFELANNGFADRSLTTWVRRPGEEWCALLGSASAPLWAGATGHGVFPSARSSPPGQGVSLASPRICSAESRLSLPATFLLMQNAPAFAVAAHFTSFNARYWVRTSDPLPVKQVL